MPRPQADHAEVLDKAESIESRLLAAFLKAINKMRAALSINSLAMVLERGRYNHMRLGRVDPKDVDAALALLTLALVKDVLAPCATIARDATLSGGRLGAAAVSKALR